MPETKLADQAYDQLIQRLMHRQWQPGQFVNRRQIAQELGLSVAPVLEAMLRLQGDGFLEVLPRRGTRVRTLSDRDVRGQYLLREALECQAARLACGAPVRAHRGALEALADAVDASDLSQLEGWRAEVRLHRALVSLSAVPALLEAYDRVMKLGLFYAIHVVGPVQSTRPWASHADLLAGWAQDDPGRAAQAVRNHIHTGREGLLRRPGPDETPEPLIEPIDWLDPHEPQERTP